MKTNLLVLIGASALVGIIGFLAMGKGIDFAPSSYNPAVEETVTLEVCESCLGSGTFRYEWDFDGDGVYEVSTEESIVTHAFVKPGFVEVGLKVIDAGGRTTTHKKGILVGESPLFAVRELIDEKGVTFVHITFFANLALSAPGLEEAIPPGWQVEVVNTEGALPPHMGEGTLEVLWADFVEEGKIWTFSYRLHSSYGGGSPTLRGIASGYVAGKRVKAQVCGDLSLSR